MSEKRRLSNVSSGLPTVRQVFILSAFVTVFAVTVGVWHFGVSGSRTARTYAAETTERSLIRTGTLGVVWSDPLPGSNEKGKVEYFLHDEKGERQSLILDQTVIEKAGGIYRLQGKRVTLRGEESPTESKDAFGKTAFGANSIELIEQIVGEEQTGINAVNDWQ